MSITTHSLTTLYHYAECHILFVVMVNVVMPSVIMLSVVMVNVLAPINDVFKFLNTPTRSPC